MNTNDFFMHDLTQLGLNFKEPRDYFQGVGEETALPIPRNLLMFVRQNKSALQQHALKHQSHHRFVLLVNAETAGVVHVDHLQIHLRPGQGLLIQPFQFHHYSHVHATRLRWMFCTFELPNETWAGGMPKGAITLTEECRKAFSELCALWPDSRGGTGESSGLIQVKLLETLLWLRKAATCGSAGLLPNKGSAIIASVNRRVAAAADMRVEALAAELDLSASHLRKRFREASGVSLGRYLENYRLNRAMGLLVNSREAVGEIALQAGYASPQAFHRAFRRLTGETPLAYRRRRG